MMRHRGGAEVLFRRRQEVEVVEAVLAGDEGRGVAGLAYPGFFGVSREPSSGDLTKSWTQAIRPNGRTTGVGLGGYPLVTLAVARDPRRRVQRAPTFAQACETVIAIRAQNWKGGKNGRQWRASVRDYAMPKLARKRVDAVTTADVMAVLLPIWSNKRQTARRVRQRIGAVMKWAVAQGHRDDNPAGDAISAALPNNRVATKHQRALPHAEVGVALARVRASGAYLGTKLAFEFLVLTASRSGESRQARCEEIDHDAAVWTIPGERMKTGRTGCRSRPGRSRCSTRPPACSTATGSCSPRPRGGC